MKIEYKGKVVETELYKSLTDQEYQDIKNAYYNKPDFEQVQLEFFELSKGGIQNTNITNYYFKELMAKVRIHYNKFSIEEVFEYKPLVEFLVGKVEKNIRVYGENNSLIDNIETALRLGTKGVASKVSNYPVKSVDSIIKKYNVNNNYYDFSCGWGARLTSALRNHINYFGTDPNYLLTHQLNELTLDYKKSINNSESTVDIKTQGSEVFVPQWENKIGVAFSSPPYFYLEDYKIGQQSWKEGISYQQWLNNYLTPTIKNIYRYLIKEGVFAINIKSFDKYDLLGDTKRIALQNGFVFQGEHQLDNISRTKSTGEMLDNNEVIMVFKKDISEKPIVIEKPSEQTSIFDFIGV